MPRARPPIDAGSSSATVTAPASVSRAASACPSVRIDGSSIAGAELRGEDAAEHRGAEHRAELVRGLGDR